MVGLDVSEYTVLGDGRSQFRVAGRDFINVGGVDGIAGFVEGGEVGIYGEGIEILADLVVSDVILNIIYAVQQVVGRLIRQVGVGGIGIAFVVV